MHRYCKMQESRIKQQSEEAIVRIAEFMAVFNKANQEQKRKFMKAYILLRDFRVGLL